MYEYKVLSFLQLKDCEKTLNSLAKEGWRLAAMCPNITMGLVPPWSGRPGSENTRKKDRERDAPGPFSPSGLLAPILNAPLPQVRPEGEDSQLPVLSPVKGYRPIGCGGQIPAAVQHRLRV